MNRRAFIKHTVLAGGMISFPYFIRPSALGKFNTIPPSNRICLGVIGAGAMGNSNLRSFLNIPDVQVTCVCDVDRRHALQTKNMIDEKYQNQNCTIYSDFREMLAREKLDAVTIAVPDHWHGLLGVACARAGLDIYGEKPLARTIREGRAICDAVRQYGRVWQTGSWQRSVGDFRRACELVINGRLGKVSYIEVGLPNGRSFKNGKGLLPVPDYFDWNRWLGPAPYRAYQDFGRGNAHWDWRWIMDYSGGQLTDWAGHHVDIAHWGMGLDRTGPVEIEGKGKYPDDGLYDVPYEYEFVCTYKNGLQMKVANASRQPHGMGTTWYGVDGWIHVTRGKLAASDPKILQEAIGPEEKHLYRSANHHQNFVDCIKSRKETITPPEIAQRSITAGLLGEIAMLTGRQLKWDPVRELFFNDSDANRYLGRSFRSPWHL